MAKRTTHIATLFTSLLMSLLLTGCILDSEDTSNTSVDYSPPSTIDDLTATETDSSSVTLNWSSASDNVSVQGYRIYRNGSVVADISGTSYRDGFLNPETEYQYRVVAYDASNNESASNTASAATAERLFVNINFQPSGVATPLDYKADSGSQYADRGNGFTYGWQRDISTGGRDRDHVNAPDQRFDTLLHMFHTGMAIDDSWEIALPPAHYNVRVIMGDPEYVDCVCKVAVEGLTAIDQVASSSQRFVEGNISVDVSDGRLTLSNIDGAENNKIAFIEINQATSAADTQPPSPPYNSSVLEDFQQLIASWKNPLFDFSGILVLYNTAPVLSSPTDGVDYQGASVIDSDMIGYLGASQQAIIPGLTNDVIYYFKIFAFDDVFNYSTPLEFTGTPRNLPESEQKSNSILAVEELEKGNSPDVVYSIFNRFALLNFGAEHAPEMYDKYGSSLVIDPASEWQYISEKSVAISWESNLPSLSYIEYSTDFSFDQSTEFSERYFHIHLHYLKDLSPNTLYNYRIVSTDERGTVYTSTPSSFSTADVPGAIRIPDDMPAGPPYVLDQDGGHYIVTQDITADSGVFNIQHSNITLDLGGHTITHGNQLHSSYVRNDMNQNGMGIFRQNYPLTTGRLKIVNGTLKQGVADNQSSDEGGFNPIYLNDQRGAEIAGITVDYHTAQTYGMYLRYVSDNYDIHHNIFKDRGWQITNRHGGSGGRSIHFPYIQDNLNDVHLRYNRISRTRQNGFSVARYQVNNEVYVDSWATNSFAMQPHAVEGVDSGYLRNNKIYLTGYHAIGISWARENLDVSNNFIQMEGVNTSDRRWYESFGDRNSLNGLRITNYGSGGQVRNNLVYDNNLIVGHARNGSEMRGTEFYSDISISGTVLSNSEIRVDAEDALTTQICAIVPQGNASLGPHPVIYRDTILKSNICHVRFGDYYGIGYNHHLIDVEFVNTGTDPNHHTIIFDGGYSRDGHIIRDGIFGAGTAYDDVYWQRTGSLSSYDVEWTLTITGGAGHTVQVYNVDDELVYDGVMPPAGSSSVPLKHATIRPVEWSEGASMVAVNDKTNHQKILHTPHRVIVNGVEQSITVDQPRTINF